MLADVMEINQKRRKENMGWEEGGNPTGLKGSEKRKNGQF